MAFIKGYKYKTETAAIAARKFAADYMGLPKNPNDTTIYWVNYNYSELDGFYYITYVEGLEAALGEPIEFEITYPPFNETN
jgi:hypothetical protein